MKYTLNLVRCFLLHSTKFQYFFNGFKSQLSNSYDNWHVQKYLKGIFHKGMLLIWKEYFTCAILSFSSPRCVIIARLNVIYTKFRRAMIAQLNKIWCVWAFACAIAYHSRPGLVFVYPPLNKSRQVKLIQWVFHCSSSQRTTDMTDPFMWFIYSMNMVTFKDKNKL